MTKVFIGGSRKITRLPEAVQERLDRIMEKKFPVLIGDANGADKAVQEYLHARGYDRVEVFCMEGICRNNVGGWNTRVISAPKGARGADFYTVKDAEMTKESTIGLMLWDGKSKGTSSNVTRLLDQEKKVVVYLAPQNDFLTLTNKDEWQSLLNQAKPESSRRGRAHALRFDEHVIP